MTAESDWPSEDRALEIHHRLIAGDPVAPSDLADAYLDVLVIWLVRTNIWIDPHLCQEAAEDAILALIKNPRSYQIDRAALATYLRMSALGDLRNILKREQRHTLRLVSLEDVELSFDVRNRVWEDDNTAAAAELEEEIERREATRQRELAIAGITPEDERVMMLMQQGERETSKFAQVLGISHLAPDFQRRAVKRAKDRLKKRLKRAPGSHVPID